MAILITGGCGYIGAHTAVELIQRGYEVISIDNFINSQDDVPDRIKAITGKRMTNYNVDLCDMDATRKVFEQHPEIEGVIHFAALKAVGESVEKPLLYYQNNLGGEINILACCIAFNVPHFIFSSSCTVYGEIAALPVTEETPVTRAASPYGSTKLTGEEILRDTVRASDALKAISLRYFNPVGAHASAMIGELPRGVPNSLVPYITQTAAGLRERLTVFGNDYPTRDGSCIRDYIHVCDIAEAHVLALEYLRKGRQPHPYDVFNLGAGQGVTVLEAVYAFEKASGVKLPYVIGPRRPGDVTAIYSDSSKAAKELGWAPQYGIEDMMATAWKWQQTLMAEAARQS